MLVGRPRWHPQARTRRSFTCMQKRWKVRATRTSPQAALGARERRIGKWEPSSHLLRRLRHARACRLVLGRDAGKEIVGCGCEVGDDLVHLHIAVVANNSHG